MLRNRTLASTFLTSFALSIPAVPGLAQVEEIVVTATKREESSQDIPVAVSAFGSEQLEELNVNTFQDYLLSFPNVTAGGNGPGQSTIYIRGVASTTPNINVATSSGIAPNVALYLDEQPVTQVGRNLDIYVADLSRVEVLPGPQGTLFGSSSQAGTVRLITNKPVYNEFSAKISGTISATKSGELSEKLVGVLNLPVLEDKLAVRAVFYNDNQGGFIDNVPGEISMAESGRFAPGGFQEGADLSNVDLPAANNRQFVEQDFNDAIYTGGRFSVSYEVTPQLSALVTHTRQKLDVDGVFAFDPTLDDPDDLSVQRFVDERQEDSFHNTAWTFEGRVKGLDLVYTGSYLDREVDQVSDYTEYLFVGQYLPYYICDASVTPGADPLSGGCQEPRLFNDLEVESTRQTHEFRFNTPRDERIRLTAGAFYSKLEVTERGDFTYTGSQFVDQSGTFGDVPNAPLPGSSVSNPNPRPTPVVFFNDITRTDEEIGGFGELTGEVIPQTLAVTFGARWYDLDVDLVGSANSSFDTLFPGDGVDANAFGSNLDQLFSGNTVVNGNQLPDVAESQGVIFKANASWTPTEDLLFYFTYSEGFRPGLLNRPAGQGNEENGFAPGAVDTDDLTNYEVGWKTNLFGNTLQFNGALFLQKISGLQTSVFNPNITNLNFAANAADAEVKGIEGDFIWTPVPVPGLTINGAFSVLDSEIEEIAQVAGTGVAEVGSDLPFAPTFQGNIRGRYEWAVGAEYTAHIQSTVSYTGESFSDIIVNPERRVEQDSYTLWGLAAGLRSDFWSLELFGENLTDTRAELFNNTVYRNPGNAPNYNRIFTNRPRTFGLRVTAEFSR